MAFIKVDMRQFNKEIKGFRRDVEKSTKFAALKSLTHIAFESRTEIQQQLPLHVDRPTNFTKKGVQVEKANKDTMSARVGFAGRGFGKVPGGGRAGAETPFEYMERVMSGGIRKSSGETLIVPISKQAKDKFGNIKRNFYKRAREQRDKYFTGVPKGMPNAPSGIYRRLGKGGRGTIRLEAKFVPQVQTPQSGLNLEKIVRKQLEQKYQIAFSQWFVQNMARRGHG